MRSSKLTEPTGLKFFGLQELKRVSRDEKSSEMLGASSGKLSDLKSSFQNLRQSRNISRERKM